MQSYGGADRKSQERRWNKQRDYAETDPMVLRAAGYLVRQGPAILQERWEENRPQQ